MGSHVHGEASLDIVIEGNTLSIAFESPAANLVGFEHAPRSDDHKALVRNATALLKDLSAILDLPASAGCRSTESHADWVQEDGHHEGQEHEEHEHEEHEHEGEGEHAEMHAEHLAECQRIDDIAELSVNLFSHFPSLEAVTLQAVVDGRQIHQSLDQEHFRVSLDN